MKNTSSVTTLELHCTSHPLQSCECSTATYILPVHWWLGAYGSYVFSSLFRRLL